MKKLLRAAETALRVIHLHCAAGGRSVNSMVGARTLGGSDGDNKARFHPQTTALGCRI